MHVSCLYHKLLYFVSSWSRSLLYDYSNLIHVFCFSIQLLKSPYPKPGVRITVLWIRIRIQLFTLMRIRIQLFTFMRIWI